MRSIKLKIFLIQDQIDRLVAFLVLCLCGLQADFVLAEWNYRSAYTWSLCLE